jgi:acetyltransferase-like isoleucine patch superfamily enzyme
MFNKTIFSKIRYPLAFFKFKKYGKNILLGRKGTFVKAQELSLGKNIFIGEKFHISAWHFKIGDNVMIGPGFTAICNDHKYNKVGEYMFNYSEDKEREPIIIENDVWIGANVTILKGVTIAEGAIIGAGSVVTRDVIPYSISFGNPCKFYKTRFESKEVLFKHLQMVNSKYTLDKIIKINNY